MKRRLLNHIILLLCFYFVWINNAFWATVDIPIYDFETAWWYTTTWPWWSRITTDKYQWLYSLSANNYTWLLLGSTACFSVNFYIQPSQTWIWYYTKYNVTLGLLNTDYFAVYIDWNLMWKWTWNYPWTKVNLWATQWSHVLTFCNVKSALSVASDAYVDYITLTTNLPIVLQQVTPVPSIVATHTPSYTFYSPIAWNIIYSWWCSSATTTAVAWNNTITFNSLADWTYSACTIKVSIPTIVDSQILTVNTFMVDTTAPTINFNSPWNWALYPSAILPLNVSYSDAGSGINTAGISATLQKWNWTAWWSDILPGNFTLTSETSSSTTWQLSKLSYWKYRLNFSVPDNIWNTALSSSIFYIDEPELIISNSLVNIWNVIASTKVFSSDLNITVKTVWAPFNVILNKDWNVLNSSIEMTDWNWTYWFWYDKSPYTSNISIINNNQVIASQWLLINTNWNKNVYNYSLKFWTKVNNTQVAWNYSWKIKFTLQLSY